MSRQRLPVSIVIPVFGAATELGRCLESLCLYAPPGCEVLVADDSTPDDSVFDVATSFQSRLPLTYLRRSHNLGFVENCNQAIQSILPGGNDVLLLNSDTQVTSGFLDEMWEVLHLHEKHGVVSPRSNNATIFSVPMTTQVTPEDAYDLWKSIRHLLPRYQVMPTAVGFCMLVKNIVLRHFGSFDPKYSPGYNEENDLVCRINRHGYSAVAAHHAFVFHNESSSFGPRRKLLEHRNRQLLDERYPEYSRKVQEHLRYGVDPVDHFSVLWRPHRPRILFDLFHLPNRHSGTSDFALSLLLHLAPLLEPQFELYLGLSEEAKHFFGPELVGYRFYDPAQTDERFDLLFRPCQIFSWVEFNRMIRLGGRIAYTHLDIIAIRCGYLGGPNINALVKTAAQLSDRAMTISEFSKTDFSAFYGLPVPFEVIQLGAHEAPGATGRPGGYVLVIGNEFHHKATARAVSELRGTVEVVALGGKHNQAAGVRWLSSGTLSRSAIAGLYDGAAIVVYPSFYEGFGMPIVDAIASGIPVVALDTAVNRELQSLTDGSRLFLVKDLGELRSVVSNIIADPVTAPLKKDNLRTWAHVAKQYAGSFEDLLSRDLNLDLIRRRWELLTTINAVHPLSS